MLRPETLILRNLINNEDYARKALPHLKPEYFTEKSEQSLYLVIADFVTKYNNLPTKEAIILDLDTLRLKEKDHQDCINLMAEVVQIDVSNTLPWLLDTTEAFCKKMAVNNAILKAWDILQGEEKKLTEQAIPGLLQEALGVSFDTRVGHDYVPDAELQFDYYHKVEARISCGIQLLDDATEGGFPRKTLNVILGGAYVGKSLVMCHLAAAMYHSGYNVLYITLELSEEMIRERIDANLLDVQIDMLRLMPKNKYLSKIADVEKETLAKLIIKEYPTSTAGKLQFEHLLAELAIKKNFYPDVIFVDYLNLCRSSRIRDMHGGGMYEYFKYVGEELRGLAVEHNVVLITATQLNRQGFRSTEFGMDDVAESFSIAMTGDMIVGIMANDELKSLNQLEISQLKNRYRDINKDNMRKFLIGIDRPKMRLYNLEPGAQENMVLPDAPVLRNKDFSSFKFD